MIKYSLKLALRKLSRDKTLSFINIAGLAVGMTCAILILLWIKNEMTYDRFHDNYQNIYRIELDNYQDNTLEETSSITQMPIGPALVDNFPEITDFVRFRGPTEITTFVNNGFINLDNIFYADSGLFNVFSFELTEGNPATALRNPNSVVLTSSAAKTLFGDEPPIGKTILYDGTISLQITGVIQPAPENSHIKYQGFISFPTLYPATHCMEWDCNYSFYTYVRLLPETDLENLKSRFPGFMWEPLNKKLAAANWREDIALRPVSDIHLHSKSYEIERGGSMQMVFLFSAIGIFIILIACINFINLTTAQLSKRFIEIGIKKVAGASRNQLVLQIFGEILVQAFVALVIAVIAIELILPAFNAILDKSLQLSYSDFWFSGGLFTILIFSVIISGSYPSYVISSFSPAQMMNKDKTESKSTFRTSLVIFQFMISVALISSTAIIYSQLGFVQHMELGFQKENIITVPLINKQARESYKSLMLGFRSLPEVVQTGASTEVPGHGFTSNGYVPEGAEHPTMFNALDIDETYLETMGMELVSGRNFNPELESDKEAFLVNETLAAMMGWDEAIGKIIERNGTEHAIIGVVRDFHFTSAREKISPLVITKKPWSGVQSYGQLAIHIQTSDISNTLSKLGKIWKNQVPSLPFEYSFLDERYDNLYKTENTLGKLFIYFTALAILISGLGVFGLILFMIEQKTKEIGIRKVLGASVSNLVLLFSMLFTKRVLIGAILSVPTTLYVMNNWLGNFAYHTTIKPIHFLLAAGIVLIIALTTVSFHALKAALRNPAEVLKNE